MNNRSLKLLLCALVFAAFALRADADIERIDVVESMRLANDYFQSHYSVGSSGWARSAYQTGNFRMWELTGIDAYYNRAVSWGENNSWLHGTDYGDTYGESADAHCCGQTYIDLYYVDPQSERVADITDTIDSVLSNNYEDDWWWIDAFYMAGSTLTRMGYLYNDSSYLVNMYEMYNYMKNDYALYNSSLGLWWRDPDYKASAPNTYWGRGNGWVIAGCARVLEQLPANDTTYRPEFKSMLQTMAAALLPWQQDDGLWRASITDPTNSSYSNPETSCTGFFTYAMAYGLNEGLLVDSSSANYTQAVVNGWCGMVSTSLHSDGLLGYTQAVGARPYSATYDSEGDYGYGAFLLAGSEILRMFNALVTISATGYQTGNPPENTMDGNFDTRWSQEGADGTEYIQYTLSTATALDHIDVAFYLGDQRSGRIAIWASSNGTSFTRVVPASTSSASYVSSSGSSTDLEEFSFTAQSVKAIRICGWGNSVSAWNSITEVNIPIVFKSTITETETPTVPTGSSLTITNRSSGRVMEADGNSNGSNVRIYTDSGATDQRWNIADLGGSIYSIRSAQSGNRSIDVWNWGTSNGTNIALYSYWGGGTQRFMFSDVGSGYFRITPTLSTGQCLDAYGTSNGSNVGTWSYWGGTNQQWAVD
ncbi:glycoside hydrolase family 88 protein [Candidatus Sumerlaeota bacterium]|nr:glycoside hydrolase family 88 protein [Candidatus Sumerlaeota bacterium]